MDFPACPGEMAFCMQPEQQLTPAAGHWDECRVQLLARARPCANGSWAAPACAHSSASATIAGLGGLMRILPNPSLRLNPRGTNVGIPLARGGHPAGTGSLVTTWSVVCSRARAAWGAPGHCHGPPRASIQGTSSSPHPTATTEPLLKNGCWLETICRLREAARNNGISFLGQQGNNVQMFSKHLEQERCTRLSKANEDPDGLCRMTGCLCEERGGFLVLCKAPGLRAGKLPEIIWLRVHWMPGWVDPGYKKADWRP